MAKVNYQLNPKYHRLDTLSNHIQKKPLKKIQAQTAWPATQHFHSGLVSYHNPGRTKWKAALGVHQIPCIYELCEAECRVDLLNSGDQMKSYREEIWFRTEQRRAYVNITSEVEGAVKKSGIREGLVLVNAMHITASVYINDDEPGLLKDYDEFLENLVPQEGSYRHNDTGEDNGDAHIKRQLMGREVVVAITNGKLDFGPWEQIFYAEFDGRRRKRVLIKVIGE